MIQCIWPIQASLGEGPLWDDRTQLLWFVDIKCGRIHCCDEKGEGRCTFDVGGSPSFIVAHEAGGFVVGNGHSLWLFDGERLVREISRVAMPAHNRMNDATVDQRGRLWFGSMDDRENQRSGAVYLVDGDQVAVMGGEAVITNGPAISGNGRWLYHVDTLDRTIWRFEIDEGPQLAGGTPFARIEEGAGTPDGVSVDAEDHVWVALWGGWGLRRYAPSGQLVEEVALPCANVTKVAFGGAGFRMAFVTTARIGRSAAELEQEPLAGGLFAFAVETAGRAMPLCSISL